MTTIILLITLFFTLQLLRVRLDNNNFRFIPKKAEARIVMNEISNRFGDEVPILIGIEREYSNILDFRFLKEVKKLSDELSRVPLVKKAVSIINSPHIEARNGDMSSSALIPENFQGKKEEVLEIKKKIRDWSIYEKSLVSDDLKALQILVFLNVKNEESGTEEAMASCKEIMQKVETWNFRDSKTYITGMPVFSEVVNEATSHDLRVLIPLVILVVILVLFISFRRFSGVVLPLLTVIVSTVWAIGAMGLFSVPLSILSTVLPVILIAVGSAYGIHVINSYYDEARREKPVTKEKHKTLVIEAVNEVIRPVLLATITTFAGFFSFCFTSVAPIFEFGLFSSLGILFAFFISITLIPSILIIRGPKKIAPRNALIVEGIDFSKIDGFLAKTFVVITDHKRSVMIFAFAAILVSFFGIKHLDIDNVFMEYFDKDVSVVKSDSFIREKFGGSKLLNIVLSSEKEGRVISSEVLKACDELSLYLTKEVKDVGKVTSLIELIKRLNQVYNADEAPEGISAVENVVVDTDFGDFGVDEEVSEDVALDTEEYTSSKEAKVYTQEQLLEMLHNIVCEREQQHISADEVFTELSKKVNYNGMAYYEIPTSIKKYGKANIQALDALIQNYLLLLAGNVDGMVDNIYNPKALKINVQLRTIGQKDTDKVLAIINEFIETNFPKDINVKIAGSVLVEKALNNLVVQSQLISVSISLLVVFLILSLYYKSLIAGLIGVIPLVISILMNFAFMGFFKIKLNIGTAMVASFAIGIGIDYTIHYLAAYQKEIAKHDTEESFLYATFLGSGKAILFNATSVGLGFAVLTLSKFNMLSELGFLIALIMLTSSLGSLTVLPTLLTIIKPKFFHKNL
ncbi:MAG: efflux RND transporter permease subunit [Treponema sp.]